jgi:hypothetical protein
MDENPYQSPQTEPPRGEQGFPQFMAKRILGGLWFLFMVGCLVNLIRETSKLSGMRFWEQVGIGVFFAGCAAIGLMTALGKDKQPSKKS